MYRKTYHAFMKISSYWLPVHAYSGFTHNCGDPLIFTYLGRDQKTLYYWLSRIFSQCNQIRDQKCIPVWKVNKYIKENKIKTDLMLVELANKLTNQQFSEVQSFTLSRWIRMYLNVDLSLSLIGNRHSIRRHIRKHSLEVEKGYSEQDFILFYEKMHKPYVEHRFEDSAIIENGKMMLEDFKRKESTIYFVLKDGERIAALYEQNENGVPRLYAVGVLNGSDEILKMGVIGALYYFTLLEHQENGIKYINIGGTSPLLKDGLTFYKLMLGARVADIKKQGYQRLKLIPSKNSSAVNCFLRSNPFIYIENESLYCAVFKGEKNAVPDVEFQRQISLGNESGVKETRVFLLNSENWLTYDRSTIGEGTNTNHS
jgi:hypothetical protein